MFRDVLSKATTLLGRQKDRCLSVRMRVNARRDFAIFDSRNEETTSFLNRKEIAVSFLVLENPSRKSGARNARNISFLRRKMIVVIFLA